MTWNIFYNTDGEIAWATQGNVNDAIITSEANKGFSHVTGECEQPPTSDNYYINNGTLTELGLLQPVFDTLTPTIDQVVQVTGLPDETEIFIDGVSQGQQSGGSLTLTIQEPGTYSVQFKKVLYKKHSPVKLIVKRYGE